MLPDDVQVMFKKLIARNHQVNPEKKVITVQYILAMLCGGHVSDRSGYQPCD
ncbi:hypothetical protein SAMN05192573_12524 [Mucilaginibacter gossypii]|uniref:Uncharacterized protein n=1 Tax=Mucilaginibacter gossypii TaxID=551996 RepID=A0A1G8LZK2_9SPHI|nr:hypothetical protein SAMN05192573_12524 [Mucilaginibacter gossypii]